jgi:multiple sugar transport system permease protein
MDGSFSGTAPAPAPTPALAKPLAMPPAATVPPTRRWGRRQTTWAIGLVVGLGSLAALYPFLWLILSSFKSSAEIIAWPVKLLPQVWTTSGFELVWTQTNLPRAYANSLLVTAAIVITVLFTSSLGGYAFARLQFPGRQALFAFTLATTMVPFVTLLIPLYLVMMRLHLLNTYAALWLPAAVSPFGIFLCRQFIHNIPRDLYDAAKVDGAGDFRIYAQIILPLIKPVLGILAVLTSLSSFNAYLWPLVALNDEKLYTLPLVLAQISSSLGFTNYQAVMAGSLLATVPPLVVLLVFQRHIVQGIAMTGLKG